MDLVNRRAIVIKPKQTFADWVDSLPSHPSLPESCHEPHELEEVRTCYLFPDSVPTEDEDAFLAQFKVRLLKLELSFWDSEQHWPKELTVEQFDYFFDIEVLPMVVDLQPVPFGGQPFDTGL
jgi:hypothetical protein